MRFSVSQINLFLAEPSIWVLNKFYDVRGEMGAAASRGKAVETGLEHILKGASFEEALVQAYSLYDLDAKDKEGFDEEKEIIKPMVEQAAELFLQLDEPTETQIRLEERIHGIEMLGFADFGYEDCYIDLKTTKRCPSAVENISPEHVRQMAYYHHASGKPQKLAYVTPKKHALYEVTQEQLNQGMKELQAACKAMWSCVEISEKQGKDALTVLYPPRDTNSFYWDRLTLNKAQEIWFS